MGRVWGAFAQREAPSRHRHTPGRRGWELAHYPHITNSSLHKATFEIKIVFDVGGEARELEQGESGLLLLHALVEELEVELVQVGLDLRRRREKVQSVGRECQKRDKA